MEFDATKTGALFAIPLLVIIAGTLTSPMPRTLSVGISVGIALFGLFSLYVGVRHGEYRASR
jgi:hypothetical protein